MNNQSAPQLLVFAKRKNAQALSANLYLKISLGKEHHEKSLGIRCSFQSWNSQTSTIKGDPVNTDKLARDVEQIKQKLMGVYYLLQQEDAEFSLSELLDVFKGNRKPGAMSFCQCFNDLILRMERSTGSEGTSATNIQKHKRCFVHFQGFCKLIYKSTDLTFQKFNRNTIEEFIDYLRTEGQCSHNTALKYLQIIKKLYRVGID